MDDLEKTILAHEGLRNHVYNDSLGIPTIGIGRNISPSGPGLSDDECLYLLRNDIERVRKSLQPYDWYNKQDDVRKDAIVELVFNLGLDGFLKFKNTIKYLSNKDYRMAAYQLLNSKWATQVHGRANNIADRIRTGRY